jgi:hypothetical protein
MKYVDQSQKLDVQSLITAALKEPGVTQYSDTVRMDDWPQIRGQSDSNLLAIEIELDRPVAVPATGAIFGQMLLKFTTPDGQDLGQWLRIVGEPATKASRRWRVVWPDGERVRTLYFQSTVGQFNSRKAAGLKYRRKLSNRPRNRLQHHLSELGAAGPNGFIPKPLWMTEAKYEYHLYGINKARIRLLSKAINIPPPDFYDEYEEVDLKTKLERVPLKDPQHLSMYCRDTDGNLQIKAKYIRKYGLPKGAAPDSPRQIWFAVRNGKTAAR